MNKANIVWSKIGEREDSGDSPSRMEYFRWLLRNGMNKTDIDGVKTKVLI